MFNGLVIVRVFVRVTVLVLCDVRVIARIIVIVFVMCSCYLCFVIGRVPCSLLLFLLCVLVVVIVRVTVMWYFRCSCLCCFCSWYVLSVTGARVLVIVMCYCNVFGLLFSVRVRVTVLVPVLCYW